jgi:hypothetical protein
MAEKSAGIEPQENGPPLDRQVMGAADIAAVDLAGRLSTEGTESNRGLGRLLSLR